MRTQINPNQKQLFKALEDGYIYLFERFIFGANAYQSKSSFFIKEVLKKITSRKKMILRYQVSTYLCDSIELARKAQNKFKLDGRHDNEDISIYLIERKKFRSSVEDIARTLLFV